VLPTLGNGQLGQIGKGTKKLEPADVKVVVRGANVSVPDLYNATGAAEQLYGLARYRFADVRLGGAYVCKRISGTVSWSDHAWGDAVDLTEAVSGSPTNDQITDWVVRMAREDLIVAANILGSQRGRVVSASAPTFVVEPSSADASHKWHTHVSCHEHSGVPPCA